MLCNVNTLFCYFIFICNVPSIMNVNQWKNCPTTPRKKNCHQALQSKEGIEQCPSSTQRHFCNVFQVSSFLLNRKDTKIWMEKKGLQVCHPCHILSGQHSQRQTFKTSTHCAEGRAASAKTEYLTCTYIFTDTTCTFMLSYTQARTYIYACIEESMCVCVCLCKYACMCVVCWCRHSDEHV